MANFDLAIVKILEKEGGATVTNISGDRGGLTKYGISQRSYPKIDIANLTEQGAKDIYMTDYWMKFRGNVISDQIVAESIFCAAANMGVRTASRLVQTALNEILAVDVAVDGMIGTKTIAALNKCTKTVFITTFTLGKIAYYAHICNKDRPQSKFLLGWINRVLGGG